MKVWNIRVTKKRLVALAVILALAAAGLLSLGGGQEAEEAPAQVETSEECVAYLEALGWQVEEELVETLQFLLPQPLEEPYLTYNVLQKSQGFDLAPYGGQQVRRCTYAVTNYPGGREGVQASLYLCGGKVIAGDIFCPGAEGFRNPLAFPE